MRVLLSAEAMKAIISGDKEVADWFKEAQNRRVDPAEPLMTVTGYVMVRTGVERCRDTHERAAFDYLELLRQKGLELLPLDYNVANRFGAMIRSLNDAGVTGYATLDILEAAAAREAGARLLARPSDALTKLVASQGLALCGPWHEP